MCSQILEMCKILRIIQSDYSYSSTQVNVEDPLRSKILEWSKNNIPDSHLYTDEENHGREDTPHITILYGILTQDPEKVKDVLEPEKGPIEVTLGKTSIFENSDDYDVVKIGVKSPDLHKLNKLLSDSLDNENSYPEYKPHVTIAYVKRGKGKLYSGLDVFEGEALSFDSVRFSDKKENATTIKLQGTIAARLNWSV